MANNEQRRKDAMRKLERELSRRERNEKLKPLGVVITTLAILFAIGGGIYLLTTAGGDESTEADSATDTATQPVALTATPVSGDAAPMKRAEALPETVTCEYPNDGEAAKAVDKPRTDNVPATGTKTVTLKTNQGDIPMELDRSLSPCGVNAIETMAQSGYFNDTVCHRVTGGGLNVLQCGDPTGTGTGGPGFKFAGEWPVKDSGLDQNAPVVYPKGSIAMANPGDPDANGSQFFLNWADSQLPPQYTILGSMTEEGTKTVEGIAKNGIEGGGTSDGKPAKEVRIQTAEVKA
ncbi:peptidylprolyl isomerase [Corynebacterium lactis]|uniref:Isomerase n=1 Tax=Corynebacterium lactis RW2-5 TaxID=1408189 RepID=A0A0K2GZX0_9CORY|nr:peptidylprolyl isomerase [Corynebacterium lactis]ALA67332.1 isomerase [Corynebacterium lactis RW2-5]